MFQFAKILLGSGSLRKFLVVLRLPWSLVTVPLMLLGWIHVADQRTAELNLPVARKTVHSAKPRPTSRAAGMAVLDVIPISTDDEDPIFTPASGNDELVRSTGTQDTDERSRKKLLGKWEDNYQGKRSLSVAEDGTGTMVVELEGIGRRIFADRLAFDLEWTSADGRITMKTLGGEPKSKAQLVLKLYGNEAEYKILELTDDRMLLLDADGKTKYDWRRPGSSPKD
jgi:hypothetical protein